ncbi:MAG: dihydroorotase [Clostridiales bacterium]|jgi:dihydroorotase|nr:dihydroorotase [Clostridiales bacterium]
MERIKMSMLIKNGLVIDPTNKIEAVMDVLVENGVIAAVDGHIEPSGGHEIIDASGMWIVPGLIDMHVHFREPGQEYKETIKTGAEAAARGGFTAVCCMANTVPPIDNEFLVEYIKSKARDVPIHILQAGSATRGMEGTWLSNIGMMAEAGISAISEDGKTVADAGLFRAALKYAAGFNLPVLCHCEDMKLAGAGSMNAGNAAALLGLGGIPAIAEELIIARDIMLAEDTGCRLHIQHVSTANGIRIIKEAKARGVNVTCEATPHHFTLCDADIKDYDTNFKMSPPLRGRADMEAIKQALADGTVDCIASDHAPHSADDKNVEFSSAANGISGLETALPLALTELYHTGIISSARLVELMSANPARILGFAGGSLAVGKAADITIINPDAEYKIDVCSFRSKGKNSPFDCRPVKGRAERTIRAGKTIYRENVC